MITQAEKDAKTKLKEMEGTVEDSLTKNFDDSKKKKPQALSGLEALSKIKDRPIQCLKTLKLPGGKLDKSKKINGLSWAQAGSSEHIQTRLAFARQDHYVGIVDVQKNLNLYGCKANFTQCIAIHPHEDIFLTGGMDNATTLWKKGATAGKLSEMTKWIEHDGYISSLHFLNKGTKYISASGDADCRIFDIESRECITRFCGHEKDAQCISFATEDRAMNVFATCSSDKSVRLWDIRSGKGTHVFKSDGELNACCMFPRELTMVAAGGEKDKAYVFDIRAARLVSKYARNKQRTASVAFSKSGRSLYIGHDDGALITWDIFSGGENKAYASKINAHTILLPGSTPDKPKPDETNSRIQEMSVNSDGVLASCGFDGNVKIWCPPDP